MATNLLINESPLQVLPTLAKYIGLNEAIFIQQLHYWLSNKKLGKVVDDKKWMFNSVTEWQQDNFPFWSDSAIKRTISNLEGDKLILSRKDLNKLKQDNTKWYTINYELLESLHGPIHRVFSMSEKRKKARAKRGAKVQSVPGQKYKVYRGQVQSVPTVTREYPKTTTEKNPSKIQKTNLAPSVFQDTEKTFKEHTFREVLTQSNHTKAYKCLECHMTKLCTANNPNKYYFGEKVIDTASNLACSGVPGEIYQSQPLTESPPHHSEAEIKERYYQVLQWIASRPDFGLLSPIAQFPESIRFEFYGGDDKNILFLTGPSNTLSLVWMTELQNGVDQIAACFDWYLNDTDEHAKFLDEIKSMSTDCPHPWGIEGKCMACDEVIPTPPQQAGNLSTFFKLDKLPTEHNLVRSGDYSQCGVCHITKTEDYETAYWLEIHGALEFFCDEVDLPTCGECLEMILRCVVLMIGLRKSLHVWDGPCKGYKQQQCSGCGIVRLETHNVYGGGDVVTYYRLIEDELEFFCDEGRLPSCSNVLKGGPLSATAKRLKEIATEVAPQIVTLTEPKNPRTEPVQNTYTPAPPPTLTLTDNDGEYELDTLGDNGVIFTPEAPEAPPKTIAMAMQKPKQGVAVALDVSLQPPLEWLTFGKSLGSPEVVARMVPKVEPLPEFTIIQAARYLKATGWNHSFRGSGILFHRSDGEGEPGVYISNDQQSEHYKLYILRNIAALYKNKVKDLNYNQIAEAIATHPTTCSFSFHLRTSYEKCKLCGYTTKHPKQDDGFDFTAIQLAEYLHTNNFATPDLMEDELVAVYSPKIFFQSPIVPAAQIRAIFHITADNYVFTDTESVEDFEARVIKEIKQQPTDCRHRITKKSGQCFFCPHQVYEPASPSDDFSDLTGSSNGYKGKERLMGGIKKTDVESLLFLGKGITIAGIEASDQAIQDAWQRMKDSKWRNVWNSKNETVVDKRNVIIAFMAAKGCDVPFDKATRNRWLKKAAEHLEIGFNVSQLYGHYKDLIAKWEAGNRKWTLDGLKSLTGQLSGIKLNETDKNKPITVNFGGDDLSTPIDF